MKKRYSICIYPPPSITNEIRIYKELLAGKIKWYHSKNSDAVITLGTFEAKDNQLPEWEQLLESFCKNYYPFLLTFNSIWFDKSGYIAFLPDKISAQLYFPFIAKFLDKAIYEMDRKGEILQLTIARRLTPVQLFSSNELFKNKIIDFSFLCDGITLRILDEEKKQFKILKKYDFKNG